MMKYSYQNVWWRLAKGLTMKLAWQLLFLLALDRWDRTVECRMRSPEAVHTVHMFEMVFEMHGSICSPTLTLGVRCTSSL